MDRIIRVQFLDETVCISHCSNTAGKGMNLTILLLALGEIGGQAGLFNLGLATNLREGKRLIET